MILNQFFSLVTEMSVSKRELTGFLLPKKQEDIRELQEWAETSSEFKLIDDNLELNKKVAFELAPMVENGLGCASYEQYFNKKLWWKHPNLENVVEHKWLKYQASDEQITFANLDKVVNLLKLLEDKKRFYVTNNDIVVFFSKKPSELALNAKEPSQLIKLIRDLNQAQINAIDEICRWFGTNTEDEHVYSKKHAFSEALSDFLIEKKGRVRHDICDLLENIVNIQEQAIAQHELYLEDFSYGKFVKKIEESVSKFTTRINDALGKSVTQVLGIPIATSVVKLAKIEPYWESVISLMIYILLCALVLFTQQRNLSYIEEEFKIFENKLPQQLKKKKNKNKDGQENEKSEWEISKESIISQLKNQNRVIQFLWVIILLAFWYTSFLIGCLAAKTDWSFFSKLF